MAWSQKVLKDDPDNPAMHMVHRIIGQPDWVIVMIVVGIIATLVGLSNIHHQRVITILTIIMGGLWFGYAAAFFLQDLDFGRLKLNTILAFFVFIYIVTHAFYSSDGGELMS